MTEASRRFWLVASLLIVWGCPTVAILAGAAWVRQRQSPAELSRRAMLWLDARVEIENAEQPRPLQTRLTGVKLYHPGSQKLVFEADRLVISKHDGFESWEFENCQLTGSVTGLAHGLLTRPTRFVDRTNQTQVFSFRPLWLAESGFSDLQQKQPDLPAAPSGFACIALILPAEARWHVIVFDHQKYDALWREINEKLAKNLPVEVSPLAADAVLEWSGRYQGSAIVESLICRKSTAISMVEGFLPPGSAWVATSEYACFQGELQLQGLWGDGACPTWVVDLSGLFTWTAGPPPFDPCGIYTGVSGPGYLRVEKARLRQGHVDALQATLHVGPGEVTADQVEIWQRQFHVRVWDTPLMLADSHGQPALELPVTSRLAVTEMPPLFVPATPRGLSLGDSQPEVLEVDERLRSHLLRFETLEVTVIAGEKGLQLLPSGQSLGYWTIAERSGQPLITASLATFSQIIFRPR